MTCRIYDIEYVEEDKSLPAEIIVDLNSFHGDVGFGNMNSRCYQAVKAITGHEAKSCKVEMVSRYPGTI
ncbi:MAG: hypothetical protein EB127_20270 [Alphaproteobacteria bacterium]|jgi:hypothetical protein|nr:hypothetical protein [Alphaproteobacteria bacterium]